MEIDPSSSLQEMVEQCASRTSYSCSEACILVYIFVLFEADNNGMMGSMMQDLAFAIPGVDEAMGFAEIMKFVMRCRLELEF